MDAASTLREARRRAGVSQRELARRAGTSPSTVAAYETGAKDPSVRTLDRLCRAIGFELTGSLVPIPRIDLAHRGEELAQVLELADAFPSRPTRRLAFPPLHRLRAG